MRSGLKPAAAGAAGDPIRLASLAGGVAPDDYLEAVQRASKLPESAIAASGGLVAPTALQTMTPQLGEQLSRFCLQHEIAEADLGYLLKLSRWLLREAAAVNLSSEQLADDVAKLCPEAKGPGSKAIAALLVEHYEPVKRAYRAALVSEALVKHGNVLVDIDWRIDQLRSERSAARLDVPIAVVTLAHRTADGAGRLTLQLTPKDLQNLAQVFSALAQKTRLAGSLDEAPGARPSEP